MKNWVKSKGVLILLCILLFGCSDNSEAARAKIRSTTFNGTSYLYLSDIAKYYGMSFQKGKKTATLSSKYSKLVFIYSSKKTTINNVVTYLSFPTAVAAVKGKWEVVVSQKDFLDLIDPILRKAVLTKQNVRRIVIDPGHGGKDHGTRGRYAKEKDIALQVSLKLGKLLKRYGYTVIMTRTTDKYLTLESRPAVASKYNADLFISIHCNGVASKSASGIETFIVAPQGTPSTYGTSKNSYVKGSKYAKNNSKLGYKLQQQLSGLPAIDRGLKHAQFKVLDNSPVPAALIELGFLSNNNEESLLRSSSYQNKLVDKIARGIYGYTLAVK